jgi:hypothetical protein
MTEPAEPPEFLFERRHDVEATPKSDAAHIREYLEREARWLGPRSLAAFILEHGRAFETDAKACAGRRMPMKQCFANATKVALRRPDMVYVEGYVRARAWGIAFHHAWLMRPDGKVFDPTLRHGDDEPSREYFGAPFSIECVAKTTFGVVNGKYGHLDRTAAEVAAWGPQP